MSGLQQRRLADVERVRALALASGGQLELINHPGDRDTGQPVGPLELLVRLPTAGNEHYPAQVLSSFRLRIELPARYPFEAPVARITGPAIFHPNVFESGVVCVGSKWLASEGLDLYVRRVIRLLCFDGMLVNMNSIAHAAAGRWYARARRQHPDAFPSAIPNWSPAADKVVRACPACGVKIRLPAARAGTVQCPRCRHEFEAST